MKRHVMILGAALLAAALLWPSEPRAYNEGEQQEGSSLRLRIDMGLGPDASGSDMQAVIILERWKNRSVEITIPIELHADDPRGDARRPWWREGRERESLLDAAVRWSGRLVVKWVKEWLLLRRTN